MSNTINVLLVIDTVQTLRSNSVVVYLIDDNPADDQGQGSNELTINCNIGDVINWNVAPIIPSWGCVLTSFVVGSDLDSIFSPSPAFSDSAGMWTTTIGAHGKATYTFTFQINGSPNNWIWDPHISSQFTNPSAKLPIPALVG